MQTRREENSQLNFQIRKRFSSISISRALFIALFSLLPFGLLLFILNTKEVVTGLKMELLISATIYLIPLALIYYAFSKKDLSLKPILKSTGKHHIDILLVIPLILFSISVIWVTILLFNTLSAEFAQSYLDFMNSIDMLVTTAETPYIDYFYIFVAVAVLPPLLEELVFRAAMIERFGRKFGFKTGVILSSILFGVMHIDVIGAIVFGVILSLIYLKTSSLFIPVVIHAINNGLVVIFIFIDDKLFPLSPWETTEPYVEFGWIGIILFIISSGWLTLYIMQNWSIVHKKVPIAEQTAQPEQISIQVNL
ncbi:MAG: CPBP family intramembrane metalloprotease [Balneolaceae bacterium]|nr:CPBP family intramembrane metalloprotease [Balneolaceae bacterium]